MLKQGSFNGVQDFAWSTRSREREVAGLDKTGSNTIQQLNWLVVKSGHVTGPDRLRPGALRVCIRVEFRTVTRRSSFLSR